MKNILFFLLPVADKGNDDTRICNEAKFKLKKSRTKGLPLFVLILFFSSLSAQETLPDFGHLDSGILENNTCEFYPGAPAQILLDVGETTFEKGIYSLFCILEKRRVRIKILNENGISRREIHILFQTQTKNKSAFESIDKINGISYNLGSGGQIIRTKLEKKDITSRIIDPYLSEITIVMPDVHSGSVFEYSYECRRQSYETIKPWYFQSDIPVSLSCYSIDIPIYFDFNAVLHGPRKVRKKQEYTTGNVMTQLGSVLSYQGVRTMYTFQNLPPVPLEPFMSSKEDYTQLLRLQLANLVPPSGSNIAILNTWDYYAKNLLEDANFGEQLSKPIDAFEYNWKGAGGEFGKMEAVYKSIQTHMRWNGIYNNWCTQDANQTWKHKTGNSTEINILLINCLRKQGLKAFPLMASTHSNGLVFTPCPFPEQFNRVLAGVFIEGKIYVLDGTNRWLSARLIPPDVIGNSVLLVDKEKPRFVTLKDSTAAFVKNITIMGAIDSNAVIHGTAVVRDLGYARWDGLTNWKKGEAEFLKSSYIHVTTNKLEIQNEENDSLPFVQNVSFDCVPETDGDSRILDFSFIPQLRENPFAETERQSDISFYYPQQFHLQELFQLPAGYEVKNQQGRTTIVLPDQSFILKKTLVQDGTNLNIRISIECTRARYSKDEYSELKDFFKKMTEALREPIVLTKKR
jgi:hypothetical protein